MSHSVTRTFVSYSIYIYHRVYFSKQLKIYMITSAIRYISIRYISDLRNEKESITNTPLLIPNMNKVVQYIHSYIIRQSLRVKRSPKRNLWNCRRTLDLIFKCVDQNVCMNRNSSRIANGSASSFRVTFSALGRIDAVVLSVGAGTQRVTYSPHEFEPIVEKEWIVVMETVRGDTRQIRIFVQQPFVLWQYE